MASIALYAGGYHFVMYLKQRREVKFLSFALLCLSVGIYEAACAGLYNAVLIEQGVFWGRIRLESIPLVLISMTWLVKIYTGRTNARLLKWVIGASALYLLLSRILPEQYTLSADRPIIRPAGIPGLLRISFIESDVGILYIVALGVIICLYVYLIACLAKHYRKTGERETLYILLSQIPVILAVANDSLVAAGAYSFEYLAEYAFVFIIVVMSYVLFAKLMRLHKTLEESKHELEDRVRARTTQIQKLNEELQRAAEIDSLTGAYNRRFLDQFLEVETRRAVADQNHHRDPTLPEPAMNFGLAMFDIDDFKQINDQHGHIIGDRVLAAVAERVRASIFERDLLCRYGGEEFVVIFTRTSREGIIEAAEKLRNCVHAEPFATEPGQAPLKITVSVGVASFADVENATPESILRAADECLLAAKRMGKDRVIARKIFAQNDPSLQFEAVAD